MRAVVTCESCGHRETVARTIRTPQAFYVVCHRCEGVLRVEVTEGDLAAARSRASALQPPSRV
jgi:transcription elongation factor Elf1